MSNDVLVHVRQFRIKELQEALSLLGLPKYGKKDELKARLERHFLELGGDLRQHELAAREVTRIWRRMKGLPLEDLGLTNGPGTSFNMRPSADGCGPSNAGQRANSRGFPGAASSPRFGNGNGNGLPDRQFPRGNTKPSLHNVLDTPLNSTGFQPVSYGRPQPGQPPPAANSAEANTEIRCVCGHNTDVGEMIQCEGEKCGVWQHSLCVGVDPREVPEHYFCELCRIARADPFWVRVSANFFPSARLIPQQQGLTLSPNRVPALIIKADREFNLTYQHLQLCGREDHQLQLACILFGDKVPFRLHWPQHADLRVNLRGYRPYSRNNGNKLGNNAVDDAANLSPYVKQGNNIVSLSGTDARPFCMVLQMAKRRSVDDVKAMMAPPETTEQALQRVRSQTGGQQNDSDDEGLEISATILSLRDPNTSTRVVTPARFLGVGGIVAFDLDTYLDVVRRSRKWLCPFSTKSSSIRELQLDGFLGPVLSALKEYPDIMEVEVSPEATWRLAGSTGRWNAITDDPAIVAAALAESRTAIKKDPDPLTSLPVNQDDGSTSEEVSEGEEMRKAAKAYASKAHVPPPPKPEVIVLSDSDSGETSKPRPRQPIISIPPNGTITVRGGMPSSRSGGSANRRRVEGGGRSAADVPRYNPYSRPLESSQSAGPRHVVSPPPNGVVWSPSRSAAMNAGRMPNQQQNPSMTPMFDYNGSSSHHPAPGLPTVQSVPLPMSSYGQQQPPGPPPPLPPMPGPPPPPLSYQAPPFHPFNATPYAPSNLQPGHIGPPVPHGGMNDLPPRPPCDYAQPQASGPGPGQSQGAGPSNGGGYSSQPHGGNFLPPPSEFIYPAPGMGGYGPPGGFPGPPLPMPAVMPGFGGQEGDFGGPGHPQGEGPPHGSGFAPLPPPPAPPHMNGYVPQHSTGFARVGSGGYPTEQQGGPTFPAGELTHPIPGSGMPVLPPPPGDNMPGPKNVGPPEFLQDSFLDQLLADGIPGQDTVPSEPDRPCGPLEPTPFQMIGARSHPLNHHDPPWGNGQAVNNGPGDQPAWGNGQAQATGPSEITVISDSD